MSEARTAPAVERNRGPILGVLRDWLPAAGTVLEIASGTGEHALWFSDGLPTLTWQPSDRDDSALASIAAWRAQAGGANLLAPIQLDAAAPDTWPTPRADAIVAINMIHIAPWAATLGLLRGAASLLPQGGPLILYGPFIEPGIDTAPSNLAFDANLKSRDPAWGLRDLAAVTALAATHGLTRAARIDMPANNLSVVFRKTG